MDGRADDQCNCTTKMEYYFLSGLILEPISSLTPRHTFGLLDFVDTPIERLIDRPIERLTDGRTDRFIGKFHTMRQFL